MEEDEFNKYEEIAWQPVATWSNDKTMLIMRHGQSVGNQKRIIQGLTDDYGLSAEGREQILGNVKAKKEDFKKINRIISSPSKRALETGEILHNKLKIPLKTNESLVEMNPGILAGKTHEFNSKNHAEYYKIWMQRKDLDGIPGAENGQELQARAVSFLTNYMHEKSFCDVVVSHAGFIRCLVNTINGVSRTTPVCVDNGYYHVIHDPLKNLKFERRTRAMASEVYIVTAVNNKYVVKMKDRNVCLTDINEKTLVSDLKRTIEGIPAVLSLSNNDKGCIKVIEYLEGEHVYGKLNNQQKSALTQKIVQISEQLGSMDTNNYTKHDLYAEMVEKERNAQNCYVRLLARDILNDSENIKKLKSAPVGLVHADLNRDNILFQQTDNNGCKVNIIDWEGVDLLPKDYQLASYLSGSLLIEGEKVEDCMKIAAEIDKDADKEFLLFLMKIRTFNGLYFFAENKNSYVKGNESVAEEVLSKYLDATQKIMQYGVTAKQTPHTPQDINFVIDAKRHTGR